MDVHPSAQRVKDFAGQSGLSIEPHEFPDNGARTADDAAQAVGCRVDQIVKSMIFDADGELVLALTAGSNQVDPAALAAAVGADACGRADIDKVRAATGYAIGGVPPFGHNEQLRAWIDPHLFNFDTVWAAAGTPRHVFALSPADLVRLTGAVEADFAQR